jgi:hypothetical protein
MADLITDLTDEDIRTELLQPEPVRASADQDATDGDSDGADGDSDGGDADDDASDSDADGTDS